MAHVNWAPVNEESLILFSLSYFQWDYDLNFVISCLDCYNRFLIGLPDPTQVLFQSVFAVLQG